MCLLAWRSQGAVSSHELADPTQGRAGGRLREGVVAQGVELLLDACGGIGLADPERTRVMR
jgi:hypothetical protein